MATRRNRVHGPDVRRHSFSWSCLLLIAVLLMPGRAIQATGMPGALHIPYARVLEAVVRADRVDYARLRSEPGDLQAYLDSVAALDSGDVDRWPRADRLALLLNLYNATTLRLVADHYPVRSIRDIGLIPGSAWKRDIVRLGGRTMTLDDLEHGILRNRFHEPRIHFALVCAARGCPPLRSEPYHPERLDAQLEDQARRFLAQSEKNRFDPESGVLWLSPIFQWFAADFTGQGGTVAGYVRRYLPEAVRARWPDGEAPPRVRYTDYDWRLNALEAP